MRLSARLTLAATCCTLVLTSACSDSTGPNTQDAAHLAAHFDSLYVTAAALGHQGSNGYSARATILTLVEVAPAFGATPTTVTVNTATGTEHWKGFELEDVTTNGGTPNDTTYFVIAYREAEAHTVLFAFYGAGGSVQEAGIVANDTLTIGASQESGATSLASVGSACTAPSSSLVNPLLATLGPLPCNSASFNTSLSLTIPSTPNVDAALTGLSFTATTFNGVRVVEPATGQETVRRVRALLRNAHGGNRL